MKAMEELSKDLIVRAGNGEEAAFEEIYKISSVFVYNTALRITGNIHDAQEVTQDVFIKAYKNLKSFAFRSSLKTWLYRITVNTAINAYNRTARDTNRRQDYDETIDTVSSPENIRESVMEKEEAGEQKKQVQELLAVLNPGQRACVVLRELQGLRYQEIAGVLNININTVRSRLKRAREAMVEYAQGGMGHGM